jgi:hypothetical protein
LRENELLYSSHLPLGVPNGLVIHHASKLHDLNVSNLFVPGWPSTSEIHMTAIEMAPV